MGNEPKFSKEQVRLAFWKTFHESGEIFFPYPDMGEDEEDCELFTNEMWEDFFSNLNALNDADDLIEEIENGK